MLFSNKQNDDWREFSVESFFPFLIRLTCDHTLPTLYSDAVKEGMIHLLVGSYVKKPDSGVFSDWSRNNAYETLHSYWLSYFNLISGQKVGLARRRLEENRMAVSE